MPAAPLTTKIIVGCAIFNIDFGAATLLPKLLP